MMLTPEEIEEFRKIYKEETGEDLHPDEAAEVARRAIHIFTLISRRLPSEKDRGDVAQP
jgi:hypothetical protein